MKCARAILFIAPLALMIGCQQGPGAGIDPFGRTTIPPPGTGAAASPAVSDPYYGGRTTTAPALVPLAQSGSPARPVSTPGGASRTASGRDWTAVGGSTTTRLQPVQIPSTTSGVTAPTSGSSAHGGRVATAQFESPSPVHPLPNSIVGTDHVWSRPNVASQPTRTANAPRRFDLAQLPLRAGSAASARAPATAASLPSTNARFRSSVAAARYGHADDYSWLKGQLEYSASQRQWKLRYIPIDGATDEHGGSVVLPSSPVLQDLQNGDFVMVRGQLLARNPNSTDFAANYRVNEITAVR